MRSRRETEHDCWTQKWVIAWIACDTHAVFPSYKIHGENCPCRCLQRHRRGPLAHPRQHGHPWEVHRAAHPVGGSGVAAHARRPRDLVPHTWCMAARGPITHSSPSQITSTLIQNISEWEFPKLNLTVLLTNVTLVRNRLAYSKSGSHGNNTVALR